MKATDRKRDAYVSNYKKRLRELDDAIEKENDVFLMDADDPASTTVRLDAYDRMQALEAERARVVGHDEARTNAAADKIMDMDFSDGRDEKHPDRPRHASNVPVTVKKSRPNNATPESTLAGKVAVAKGVVDAGKFSYKTYDTFKKAIEEEKGLGSAAEKKFFRDHPEVDKDNMSASQRASLRRARTDAKYDHASKVGGGFMSSIPVVGSTIGEAGQMAVDGISAVQKWGENARGDGDDSARVARDRLEQLIGARGVLGMGWDGPSKGRPTKITHRDPNDPKTKDMLDVWANAYEYATSDMDEDWYELPYAWSKIDISKLKTEAQMLEYFQRSDDHQYQVYLNQAQLETGDKPKGEWDNWYLRAKNEGLIGKQTPYAIEQLFRDDYKKQRLLDDMEEAANEPYRINEQQALPGSAVYGYGDDRYYYGDSDYNPRSEPVYIPRSDFQDAGNRFQREPRYRDDDLETRPIKHLNSKNTALTVPLEEVRRNRQNVNRVSGQGLPPPEAFRARGYEPPVPIYSSAGTARYVNPTPYRELDADAQVHGTYDSSANPSFASAVAPSGQHTQLPKLPPSALSENPFLVGIGDDEHTGKILIGTEISNEDYGTNTGAPNQTPDLVPVESVNAANEKNPQAPVIEVEKPVAAPGVATLPNNESFNFIRGPSAIM